jgi:hypothetical protein
VKVINSAGPGWQLWRKGWPHPLAKLTTNGEVWTVHPGFTEEALQFLLDNPSDLARKECFLTPAGMRFPKGEHAVNLGVFLDLAVKHRSGLLGDKFGPTGRPRKARVVARKTALRPSIHAAPMVTNGAQATHGSTRAENAL